MTYEDLLKDLKQKQYKPLYVLHGEEPFFLDKITDYFEEHVLSESEKAFNYTVVYGKEADAKSLIDAASRYPMMASHQLIILKEAQEMKTLKDLQLYCEKPVPTTIFVICHKHKKLDMRTKFGKALKANGVVFQSNRVYDNQVGGWIENYLRSKKLQIEPNATDMIAEYLGTNLSKVANELDKLSINLAEGTKITPQIVQDNIGISKDYNVFELQEALGSKNVLKANRIIQYFISNPKKNPLVVVISTVFSFFSKTYIAHSLRSLNDYELAKKLKLPVKNEYAAKYKVQKYRTAIRNYSQAQIEKAIGILKDYDLRSKGVENVNTSEGELLKEMVYKILH